LLKRWNHQVERIGWEIWMMIMIIHSFHNDEKKSGSSSIFSILHNQTPQHTRFQFLIQVCNENFPMPRIHQQVLLFYQLHKSRIIHPFIHPSIHNLSTCDKHWVLDLVAHSYYLKAWVWWYLQLFIYLFIYYYYFIYLFISILWCNHTGNYLLEEFSQICVTCQRTKNNLRILSIINKGYPQIFKDNLPNKIFPKLLLLNTD
jgi:hypothetical protein